MKKLIAAISVVGLVTLTVYGQSTDRSRRGSLERLAKQVFILIDRDAQFLNQQERKSVRRNLNEIKRTLNGDMTPVPTPAPPRRSEGYFCVATCNAASGSPSMRYSKGGKDAFELGAKQNAINAVNKAYTCNYGVKSMGCDELDSYKNFNSIAACTSSTGKPSLRYSKKGKGSSALEAQENARTNLKAAGTKCNYGISIYKTSQGYNSPAYCVAACSTSTGSASLSYSKGASGSDEVEAMANAVASVKSSHTCNYGIVISECSNQ